MDEEQTKIDPFIGTFNIDFNSPRASVALGVKIVDWKTSPNAELFYLISDDGSLYNFHNINRMTRVGD